VKKNIYIHENGPQCQTISGQISKFGIPFPELPKTKRQKSEKVLYVKSLHRENKNKNIYKRKGHEIRRVLT
jgi:hypothetical protein